VYEAEDQLDSDGFGSGPLLIRLRLIVQGDAVTADFSGTAPQAEGGVNAVAAITTSAARYVVRCIVEALLDQPLPAGGGEMTPLRLILPRASLVAAEPPASVAAGNVETSQRITDVLLLAFAKALPALVPAQSQGTMNNLAIGGVDPRRGQPFAYYETMAGGMGAGPLSDGLSGVHVHMTNSLNTPIEALEHAYPLRILRYALRLNTGGAGLHRGGDGARKDVLLLADADVSLLSERRERAPAGLAGGFDAEPGFNCITRNHVEEPLPAKTTFRAYAGDVISIRSPGGGGWGQPSP
jgi:N-methylhydantoinase B